MLLCLLLYCRHFLLSFVKLLIFAERIWTCIAKSNQQSKQSYVYAFIISLCTQSFSTIEVIVFELDVRQPIYIHHLPFWESLLATLGREGVWFLLKPNHLLPRRFETFTLKVSILQCSCIFCCQIVVTIITVIYSFMSIFRHRNKLFCCMTSFELLCLGEQSPRLVFRNVEGVPSIIERKGEWLWHPGINRSFVQSFPWNIYPSIRSRVTPKDFKLFLSRKSNVSKLFLFEKRNKFFVS